MRNLDDYTNEPNYTGDAQHEADSLLNRGGLIGAIREGVRNVIRYHFFKLIVLIGLMGLGIGFGQGDKIASKLANYDIKGGINEIKKTGVKSTFLNAHWIYKTEFAAEFKEDTGKDLSSVADFVSDEGDFLVTKEPFKEDIYDIDLFGGLFTDATETCEDEFLDESYPIKHDSNYFPNDDHNWEGKEKFRCVYRIGKKTEYKFKGKE
jgi:hypothetical protein